ncbi:MAG: threonylcarbamoyl-AMP synthase [Alphaproteobacteria bacterium CG11_big_fil_rev_8_21_14_0_20_39_49]|nr:MAG: threonylcarbamoyl-AMP synthase [Alphaproteobacteria bacterium CG11_big_fil_rev_8_21_14_0_20_39_49]
MESLIIQASILLENGKSVSFPTETVYALAANAKNENALEAVFKLKGREFKKPLALLVENIDEAKKYVDFNEHALMIAKKLCPGPISMVLPKSKGCDLPDIINGGMDTLSVRIPDHKTALEILRHTNCPVVATSANLSGKPDALCASEVRGYFGDKIDMVIEGGGCSGEASTVIDLCGDSPKILRKGKITMDDILKIIEK